MPYGNEFDITIARTISVTMEARLSDLVPQHWQASALCEVFRELQGLVKVGARLLERILRTHEGTTYISSERGRDGA